MKRLMLAFPGTDMRMMLASTASCGRNERSPFLKGVAFAGQSNGKLIFPGAAEMGGIVAGDQVGYNCPHKSF